MKASCDHNVLQNRQSSHHYFPRFDEGAVFLFLIHSLVLNLTGVRGPKKKTGCQSSPKKRKQAPQVGFELGTLRSTGLRTTTRPQWLISPQGRVVDSMELELYSSALSFPLPLLSLGLRNFLGEKIKKKKTAP